MAKQPYVAATPRSMFGDAPEEVLNDPNKSVLDVEGYSDKRQQIELALRQGMTVEALTHRYHWVRSKGSASRVPEFRSKGYKAVTKEQCSGLGIQFDPERMDVAPDGTIQCGDLTLMVTSGSRAAALKRQHDEMNDMETGSMVRAQSQARNLGTEVTVETSGADDR